MDSSSVFSLEGKGLRLETASDIESHLQALRDNANVREVRLGGNTLGVEACKALADVLKTKESLEVCSDSLLSPTYQPTDPNTNRPPT